MSSRIERFAAVLQEHDVDVFLTTSPFTMGYLKGLHEGGGERLLGLFVHRSGRHRLICPALSENQARRGGVEDVWSWRDGEDAFALVQQTAAEWGVAEGRWAIDDETRAQHVLALQEALPGHNFVRGGLLVAELTQHKTKQECDDLDHAGRIADEAFAESLPQFKAGMTERQCAAILIDAMIKRGGKPTFCIIAAGPLGAEPHHETDETVIAEGDVVVIDWGCTFNGYNADSTRTVSFGEPRDPDARRVYDLVFRAQKAARDLIRPGVSFQDIDRAARRVIDDAGFGEYFNHRTGHGLGLRGHEDPNVVEGNAQLLEPGHVFSIEPGIYLPGRFGVRIENIVVVTETGHHSFNGEPPAELVIL